jgi:sulfur carrier protein
MAADPIEITVNGQQRTVPSGTTVAQLILLLGLGDRTVAVERNRDVIPRATHAQCVIDAGDVLELVSFVGGG